MGDHRPRLGPAGDPHRRCASQGWDSGWYAYSEDDAGPLSGLEGSGLRIGSQSGRTVMSGAVFCALAILLLSQAVPAGAADPEKVLLIPVPGTADWSAGLRPAPEGREKKPRALPATGQRKDSGDEAEVQRIVELANQGDCPGVIAAAERYLARHPRSSRQATVLWHQAECYRLMLRSGQ